MLPDPRESPAARVSRMRVFSFKFIALALSPTFLALLAGEAAVRVRYFFAHNHDWTYLTTVVDRHGYAAPDAPDTFVPPPSRRSSHHSAASSVDRPLSAPSTISSRQAAPPNETTSTPQRASTDLAPSSRQAAPTSQTASADQTTSTNSTALTDQTASKNQIAFKWKKTCVDQTVYSSELHQEMPRTWDDNCFRGDHVTQQKPGDEYRIVFVGGSTVEDVQSDAEMMTAQFKRVVPPTHEGKRITVVNAGKAGFESERILLYWRTWINRFSPDLVLYYEGFNEQTTNVKWARVNEKIGVLRNQLHEALYYRSLLYTYLVEKFAFLSTREEHFWKSDLRALRKNFTGLAHDVRASGSRFVFVTQIARFPRMWKGTDTFDYRADAALLDRLRADRHYVYDASEISALNQRMVVSYTIDLCRENNIPVINILDTIEALGETRRAELFIDLAHLSVKGDRMVGELIANRLNWSE
ncbi:MAG: hypothetical protein HY047_08280 [Acidobacteria bacterium]|nr:hypothetical protein [Acidobacteriota bacterium]